MALVAAMAATAGTAQAGTKVFLDVSGVQGGVIEKGREGYVLVDAYAFTGRRTPPTRTRPAGLLMGDLKVTKPADKATPAFYAKLFDGSPITAVRMLQFAQGTVSGPGGSTEVLDHEWCFEGVRVTGLTAAGGTGVRDTEELTLSYETISVRNSSGAGTPAFASFSLVRDGAIGFPSCP